MTRTLGLRSIITRDGARFIADERGATAIEYTLMAAGISVVIASTVFGLGSELKANYYDKLAALFP
jgi:pilus assembly protein Flp/PilA